MADTLDIMLIDKRVAERNIKKGLLDAKAYERHIKNLPDMSASAAVIESKMEATRVTATGSHPEED